MLKTKRLTDIFIQLVKIDSPSGQEGELADFLIDYLKKNQLVDFVTKDTCGNVYARKNGIGEPLFFAAHMDTVEPGRGINPQIKDGYIASDGTTILGGDNKIAITCILETIQILKQQKAKHNTLEIIFTLSEESDGCGARNLDYSRLKAKKGFCFDISAPIGTIVTAGPFYERVDLVLKGKAAHASLPEKGVNALSIFNSLLNSINLGRNGDDFLFNIGVVKSGSVRNTIPEEVIIKGEMRSLDENKLEAQKKEFVTALEKAVKKYQGNHTLEIVRENPGYKYQLSSPELIWIKQKIKSAGFKPVFQVSWAVADANIFNNQGLACINLGEGSEFTHTKEERVKISELKNLVKLMLSILKP